MSGTTTVAAVGGIATFSGLSINKVGSYTLAATAPGLPGATSVASGRGILAGAVGFSQPANRAVASAKNMVRFMVPSL